MYRIAIMKVAIIPRVHPPRLLLLLPRPDRRQVMDLIAMVRGSTASTAAQDQFVVV